jgi:hypothetical protein
MRLRPHRVGDSPDSFARWSQPAVVAFTGGTPSTRQRARLRVLQYAGLLRPESPNWLLRPGPLSARISRM